VISGFRRGVREILAILGRYAALIGNQVTYVSAQSIGPTFKDRTDKEDT
jgi:hypothetical protein